jgi:hypothetical protein
MKEEEEHHSQNKSKTNNIKSNSILIPQLPTTSNLT